MKKEVEAMMPYNKRTWLNSENSPSTGLVVAFDGETTWHGEKIRNTFLQVSDCNFSARLHKCEDDSMYDFIRKMRLLASEVQKFADYLEATERL